MSGTLTPIASTRFQRYETDYYPRSTRAHWLQLSEGDLDAGSTGFQLSLLGDPGPRYALQTLTATDDVLALNAQGIFGAGGGNDRIAIPSTRDNAGFEYTPITVLAGAGDDLLQGNSNVAQAFHIPIITAYGGSGADTMLGGTLNDYLEGDGFDSVIQNGHVRWFFPDVPSPDEGDDKIFGSAGADTLLGNGGNDVLYGGPRLSGDLDLLTGGEGADLFLASYSPYQGPVGSEFWGGYAAHVSGILSGAETLQVLEDVLRGGAYLGGMFVPGLAALTSSLTSFLGALTATEAAPTAADIQIVTDFDPTQDTLVIPFGADARISYAVAFEAAGPNGLTGYYASFTTATGSNAEQEFMRVFLDPGYLALMNIDANGSDQGAGAAIIESILGQTVTFSRNGDLSGLVAANVLDALGGPYTAPSGASVPAGNAVVYGAFAPVAKTQDGDDANTYVSGTVYSDVLSINESIVDPLTITTGQMNDREAYLRGFAGADLLYGTSQADTLIGDEGDDALHLFTTGVTSTGYVTETADGGAGNDTIYVGETAATIDGGAGTDTLVFQWGVYGTPRAVEVDLTAAEPVATELDADGQASGFVYRLTGIESVTTGDLADTITGTGGTYIGNGGNDTITAGEPAPGQNAPNAETHGRKADASSDPITSDPGATGPAYVIEGGAGDDQLNGTSNGTISGGPGADVMTVSGTGNLLDYSGSPVGVAVNVVTNSASGGDAEGDQISGFTHLTGSAGDDTLTAGNGARIDGDGGSDVYAADLRTSAMQVNTVLLAGFEAADDRIDLRPVGVTAFSDLDIVENESVTAATATGQRLAYVFEAGEQPVGTLTADNFIFATAGSGRLVASPDGDGLVGGGGPDDMGGRSGDDFLFGRGGSDRLTGFAGNDALHGQRGNDALRGGAGDDHLFGGAGADVLRGGAGRDHLDGGGYDDRLRGGDGADLLFGRSGDDRLMGGAGNDRLFGGGGDDVLIGAGDGAMTGGAFRGGTSVDRMNGGAGADLLVLAPASLTVIADFEQGIDRLGLSPAFEPDSITFAGEAVRADGKVVAMIEGIDTATLTMDDVLLLG